MVIKFTNESSNTFTKLNNVTVKLVLSVVSEPVEHHDKIKLYINNISKYIDKRTELQTIVHDTKLSKITISTSNGTIKCPLIMGSIMFYLNDGNKTIKELSDLMKIKESEIEERIKILMFYNVVISLPDNHYKYIEPYGTVDCEDALPASSKLSDIKYVKFTDIIMTVESRIMKEVKSKKRNKMELEQSIQEFLGTEYSRSIYYNQLESLKKRFYIEEKGDYIEYIV
jgi:hypothetical protein